MSLPKLTSLQFAVVDCLQARKLKGRELRDALLSKKNIKKEGPAFYMAMGRMEDSGLVKSSISDVEIGGKIYKEKIYWVTGAGYTAYQNARSFFEGSSGWKPLENNS